MKVKTVTTKTTIVETTYTLDEEDLLRLIDYDEGDDLDSRVLGFTHNNGLKDINFPIQIVVQKREETVDEH